MRRTFLLTLVALAALAAAAPARGQAFLGRPTKAWMNDLKDKDPEVRRSAAFALGKSQAGGETNAVAEALTHSLADKDAGVRDFAASALGDVLAGLNGAAPAYWGKAGPALQKALKDDEPRVRRSAAVALGAFGPTAAPARDDLVAALADPSALVRQNAAWALGKLGKDAGPDAVTRLRSLLRDDEPLVRRDALHALGEVGNPTAHPAVSAMLQAAGTESDGVVRKAAVEALAKLVGKEDGADAPALYPLLKDKDPETRYNAAIVLSGIGGPQGAEALPVLREALKDDDPHFQELAAAAIGGLGKDGAPAAEDLGRALISAEEPAVRRNAALSLAQIGPGARKALPQLVRALQYANDSSGSRYNFVRPYVAEALSRMDFSDLEAALPAVLEIIRADPAPEVRHRCIGVLFHVPDLDKYKVTPVLAAVLEETDPDFEATLTRYEAATVLAVRLQSRAPDKTVDVLLDMLNNRKVLIFNGNQAQVSGVGTEGAGGVSAAKENLGGDARPMAAEALGSLGRKANRPEVVKALQEAAQEPDADLKAKAKEALRLIK